jgi:hypothetical protein
MRGAQAQSIGRFQDDDQSTHVHVRGLHAPKVCARFAAIERDRHAEKTLRDFLPRLDEAL